MCVFEACPDPTTPGVWWRDDAAWRLYDAANQQRIRNGLSQSLSSVDLGLICSSVHPSGATYVAHLKSMQQANVSSNQRRDIKIIDQVPTRRISLPTAPSNTAQPQPNRSIAVHFRDESGVLRQYEPQLGNALLRALYNNQTTLEYNSSRKGGGNLRFDLINMKQMCSDGRRVDVIVEVPWNPVTMSTILASKTFRRKVICDIIDCKIRYENVVSCLKPKLHPLKLNKLSYYNPFLSSGNRVYDSFVDIMETSYFGKRIGGVDQPDDLPIIASKLNAEKTSDGLLKMVLSAETPEKNYHAMFQNGVHVQASYFSCFSIENVAHGMISDIINVVQLKFVVFLVVVDAVASPLIRAHQMVCKSEQLLPVARIDMSELCV